MGSIGEDTIALEFKTYEKKSFFYIPGCASVPNWLKEKINGSDIFLI